jgi:hypothetical protein
MHRRALEGSERVLGEEHPDTLTSVYYLAFLFHLQQHYYAALECISEYMVGISRLLAHSILLLWHASMITNPPSSIWRLDSCQS